MLGRASPEGRAEPESRRRAAPRFAGGFSCRKAMSRPRFLADQDFNEHIIQGVLRREPAIEFVRLRDLGLEGLSDPEILVYAVVENRIVVSHDVNTMSAAAHIRLHAW